MGTKKRKFFLAFVFILLFSFLLYFAENIDARSVAKKYLNEMYPDNDFSVGFPSTSLFGSPHFYAIYVTTKTASGKLRFNVDVDMERKIASNGDSLVVNELIHQATKQWKEALLTKDPKVDFHFSYFQLDNKTKYIKDYKNLHYSKDISGFIIAEIAIRESKPTNTTDLIKRCLEIARYMSIEKGYYASAYYFTYYVDQKPTYTFNVSPKEIDIPGEQLLKNVHHL